MDGTNEEVEETTEDWERAERERERMQEREQMDEEYWQLAASGDLGDVVNWKPEFEICDTARSFLCDLEDVGEKKVDWDLLLRGLPKLRVLSEINFPPLYNQTDFDEIDGFMTYTSDPECEGNPGQSFTQIRIYVDREMKAKLLQDFSVLTRRLESYEPLNPDSAVSKSTRGGTRARRSKSKRTVVIDGQHPMWSGIAKAMQDPGFRAELQRTDLARLETEDSKARTPKKGKKRKKTAPTKPGRA